MKIVQKLLLGIVLSTTGLLTAYGAIQGGPYPERQKAGTIEIVELHKSSLIVDGIRYRVALDAQVEISGSYGAFSMLQVGMKVNFTYRDISNTRREIVRIQQIPSRFRIEEV